MNKIFGKLFSATALVVAAALPLSAHALCISLTGACGYTKTKYPIVLVHGFLGFDHIGIYPYFYGISESLQSYDGARVYTAQISAANSTEVRGEQLLAQVRQIAAATGAGKVNLIGHSHGALTARYVASVRPDLVASVTSVGGPNKGTEAVAALSNPVSNTLSQAVAQLVSLISGEPGMPQDMNAFVASTTGDGILAFNARHPQGVPTTACGEGAHQVNGVNYYSWSGVQHLSNALDASDPILAATGLAFNGEQNDGAIGRCSSHLGQVIRDNYGMNHLDEINQTVGLVSLLETNPLTVYRQHANRLKNAGL
ncbi:MAG: triacylglycerol lipase [Pseudomonadota bacterium]